MNFILLNNKLEQIKLIDKYESLIWTDRYDVCGDFEIYTTIDFDLISKLNENEVLYLWCSNSDHLMVVDQFEIETSFDTGSKIKIIGRSLESILERRIIWGYYKMTGNLQDSIEKLLIDNIINPKISTRKIDNFIFEKSSDTRITSLTYEREVRGEDLYTLITEICKEKKIGFHILLNDSDQFVFSLYAGIDRSYDQTENAYVIFSTDFENLGSSNYALSFDNYRNVVAIAEEEPNNSGKPPKDYVEYNPLNKSGIYRREVLSNESIKTGKGTESGHDKDLKTIGDKELKNNKKEELFEGQIDSLRTFVYGRDFVIGDIVQVKNEYGIGAASRIVELVMNIDQDTYEMYPTFEAIDKEESKS